jgi:ATP-dependent helicase/nuclease subunit B
MNAILSKLADVCANHKTEEKLLVVPNRQSGYQLLEALAWEGAPWLNLRPVTPFELALETAAPELAARRLHLLTTGEALYITETLLAGMADRDELYYFAPLQQAGGLARIILNTVDEIRLTGLTSLGFDPTRLVSAQKGAELKNILCRYESALRTNCFADTTEVYRLAVSRLCCGKQPYNDVLFLIPAQLETQPLANKFLTILTRNRVTVLPQEPVLHLKNPEASSFIAEEQPAPESPFTWLHHPEDAPETKDINIFHAYGSANEIREIFRRLKSSAVPLDQALICYTSSRYIPLLFSLAARHSVPVTFGEGIPLSFIRPGRLIEDLLVWLENKYSASLFYQILTGGNLDIPATNAKARILRRARIGWGRERYLPRLEADLCGLKERLHSCAEEDEGLFAFLEAQIEHTNGLLTLIAEILTKIPATDADCTVDFPAFTAGLADLLCHVRISNEKDAQALDAIRTQLAEAAKAYPGRAVEREAVERIRLRLTAINVGSSPPKPGHIHAAGLSQGEWSLRPHTFVVGLDAGFPGAGLQDPVLLDQERKNLCKAFAAYADVPASRLFNFTRFLASRRGKVTLSFSLFDTAEGRPVAPASVLLQAYRLTGGNPAADYSDLMKYLQYPAGFIPASLPASLAEEEWWLAAAQSQALDAESVTACYPGLAAGLQAEAYRDSTEFTIFDGLVTACCSSHDPRQNADRVLSATQFEKLANCPFAYFIRYILRIEAPDEAAYDPGVWLDPMTRGSLLHAIYCQYLREIHTDSLLSGSHDKERLMAIAGRLIAEMKEEVPPPGELVFEHEREELLRGLEVFWRVEQQTGSVPAFFEVPFGFGDADISEAGIGLAEPVTLTLPGGGRIKLRGRIDRIDRSSTEDHYQVWDFKTGSMYGYCEQDYFKKGTQVQHALYAYAAEQILVRSGYDSNAKIESAGYLFPTEKGEGERVVRLQTGREGVLAILEKGLEIIAGGLFHVTDSEGRCGFCDYTVICRNVTAIVRANLKRVSGGIPAWKELQEYE